MQLTYVEGFFIKFLEFLEFLFILINYNLGQWSIQISLWISQTIVLLIKYNCQFRNYESWMFTKRFMNDPFLTSKDRLILWCTWCTVCTTYIIFTPHMIVFFSNERPRREEKWKIFDFNAMTNWSELRSDAEMVWVGESLIRAVPACSLVCPFQKRTLADIPASWFQNTLYNYFRNCVIAH